MSNYQQDKNLASDRRNDKKDVESQPQSKLSIWLGGNKYYITDRNESEDIVYLRGEKYGICLMKTHQCIVVGLYEIDSKLFCKNVGKLNRKVFKFGTMLKKFLF